ncbi:MAG: hypothetical protein ACR2ML_11115 [Solirubrobacteraceae bacterium]
MKPRRPIDALTAAVEDVAGSLRRRRESRALRIRLYDAGGRVRTLDPDDPVARPLVEAADALLSSLGRGEGRP